MIRVETGSLAQVCAGVVLDALGVGGGLSRLAIEPVGFQARTVGVRFALGGSRCRLLGLELLPLTLVPEILGLFTTLSELRFLATPARQRDDDQHDSDHDKRDQDDPHPHLHGDPPTFHGLVDKTIISGHRGSGQSRYGPIVSSCAIRCSASERKAAVIGSTARRALARDVHIPSGPRRQGIQFRWLTAANGGGRAARRRFHREPRPPAQPTRSPPGRIDSGRRRRGATPLPPAGG